MPISTVLHLFPTTDVRLPPTMGHLIHAAFLNIIRQVEPDMAAHLHESRPVQPFTVSPLQGRLDRRGDRVLLRTDEDYWLRFTVLDDILFVPLSRFFLNGDGAPTIRLGQGLFRLTRLSSSGTGDDEKWSGHATYQELFERAEAWRWITLRFYSTTTFKERDPAGGKSRNAIAPDPIRCIRSWANKWNAFSPLRVNQEEVLAFVARHARSDGTRRLETPMQDFGEYKQKGFIGEITIRFDDVDGQPPDEGYLRLVNMLADFALYCGTGYKTPMGMGQTRRIG